MIATLIHIFLLFAGLSLLAFGGGNAIIPQMLAAIVAHGWMTGQEFLDIFAISRATPGPGTLFVILVGFQAAGMAGAMVAFIGMFAPPGILIHVMARFWHGARGSAWYGLVGPGRMDRAIVASTGGWATCTQPNAERASVMLCATVKAVIVLSRPARLGTSSTRHNTNNRWSAPPRMCRTPKPK